MSPRPRCLRLFLAAGLWLATSLSSQALTLYVAPEGNDAWSGTLPLANLAKSDGPLASLAGARDALRQRRATGPLEGAEAKVLIADGTYLLPETLVLEPQDSGRAEQPVIFAAAPGAHPLFSGGRRITGFKPAANGLWQVELPEVRDGHWTFEQLYVNGRRATRARTPNADYFQAVSAATEPVAGVPVAAPLGKSALVLRPEDLSTLAGLSPEELHDVNALVYHSWQSSRHRVAGFDRERGTLQFTGPARWGFFESEPFHRVVLENYRAALDAPGEWFLDRQGVLLYQPRPGELSPKAEAWAPALGHWLQLRGEPEKGRYVEYLEFRGLRFADSQFLLGEKGWSDAQADAQLDAAIIADGARHVVLEDCDLSRTGNYALWFRHGCSDSAVRHSHLHDMGAGGIKIGETVVPTTEGGQTHHIAVENCIVQGGGAYFPGSVGVWVGQSGDNSIVHNDIGDLTYSAISVGWIWGFKPSLSVRNRVEWNHLHHLGWGVLSDLGAVYTLGVSPGTVVRNNRVHDIACYSYGGWGLYPDEGSSGILFENNLVYRTESGGFHQHYGRDNLVRNNIFADAREMQLRHSRSEDHLAFTFEQNIVLWDEGKLLGQVDQNWRGTQVRLARNLYWKTDGQPFDFAGQTKEAWLASGQDAGSVFADPRFVDAENGDFDLPADSPASAIGFVSFPYEKAGVEGDREWVDLARERTYAKMDFSPLDLQPPPLQLHEGFEFSQPGANFPILKMQTGGRAEAAVVTAELACEGKQCLQVTDGPDLHPAYNPHFYYQPRHQMGVSTFGFDLRVEANSDVSVEWRNAGKPYRIGPALRISHGALSSGGRQLMTLPPLQWIHLEMEAQLGGHASGDWTLRVSVPEQSVAEFNDLKFIHSEAKSLDWLGFISPGQEKARYWIDNIDLRNEQQPATGK